MGLTTRYAFEDLDAVRKLAEISIEDVASLVGVTPLTYKRWRNGAVPRESRLDNLIAAADKIWSMPLIKKNFKRVG